MKHSASQKTLLIVEDDDALRESLARAMRKRGFSVATAASVGEALAQVRTHTLNFAIVDLRLDDGSGLDVIQALERRNAHVRAIVFTGYGDLPTAVAAVRLGAIDVLTKPATAGEIEATLLAPKDGIPPAPEETFHPDEARFAQIRRVYREAGDNTSETARLLKMHRRTLQRILRRAGIKSDAA